VGVYGSDPYATATCHGFKQEGITYPVCGCQELNIIEGPISSREDVEALAAR
jgi:hypothetical protein